MRRLSIVALIAILVIGSSACGFAATDPELTTKVNRGAKNVITAPVEIPRAICEVSKDSNIIFGVLFGPIKGILNCFSKATSGVVDVATCNAGDEEPLIKAKMVPDIEPKPAE